MGRLCERPGCSAPADAMYALDAERLTVWVEPFDADAGFRAGVLCRRHADAMVVPIGWMLDDRREPVPTLFKTRAEAEAPAARPKERRTRSAVADPTGQLELIVVDDAHVDDARTDDAHIDDRGIDAQDDDSGSVEQPWKPTFDHTDDLGGLLATNSPLLSRAFGNLDRPRKR